MQNKLDAKRVRDTLRNMRPDESEKPRAERVSDGMKGAFGTPQDTPAAPAEAPAEISMPASLKAIITDRLQKLKGGK